MACGLVQNSPRPSDAELAQFYRTEYRTSYKGSEKPRRRQIVRNFRRAVQEVHAHRGLLKGRVLDIGAGSGEFLFAIKAMGGEGKGIEPNVGYQQYCVEALGLDIALGDIADLGAGHGAYDVIRLNHVVEHLNDPIAQIAALSELLTPDGVFYISVPNIETYCRTKSVGNMFHYGHIFNFSPVTLRQMLQRAGMEELAFSRDHHQDTTSLFARKAPRYETPRFDPAHAQAVRGLIDGHYAGQFTAAKKQVGKPLRKLTRSALDTLRFKNKSPAEIGHVIVHQSGLTPASL